MTAWRSKHVVFYDYSVIYCSITLYIVALTSFIDILYYSASWCTPSSTPSLRFPHQNPVCTSLLPHTFHLIFLDLITRIIFGEYRTLSSSLCSLLHSPATSAHLGPNILLNTLFSNTLSLRSSPNVSDKVPNSYKTKGKIKTFCTEKSKIWGAL